jgi:hypothetical protein
MRISTVGAMPHAPSSKRRGRTSHLNHPFPALSDDHDSLWKEVIAGAFAEFVAFYFPDVHRAIDWTRGHVLLDKELRQVVRDAASGRKFVDVLARVTGMDAAVRWLYVHVEVQTQRDNTFAKRMFTYHHRLIDRWGEAVASMAVLADDSPRWRPRSYRLEVLGCRHVMTFPVAKLLDHEPDLAALPCDPNPFALVTAAHLMALRSKRDVDRRFAAKRLLVGLLYQQGWSRQRVIDLFAIIDWMLGLPKPMEQQVWQDIEDIERKADMRYVTSVERLAIERGMAQGLEKGLEKGREQGQMETLVRQLSRRFGPLPMTALARLQSATPEQLDRWTDLVLDAPTLDGVLGVH